MYKFLFKAILTAPAVLGATLALSSPVFANEVQQVAAETNAPQSAQVDASAQLQLYSNEGKGMVPVNSVALDQVTNVSELSDVQPTDWAFQALQSLVERYGCIEGYPDQTYRGNRALTRYEFAAGLNSCLDRVNELIAAGTTGLATKEDLATLQKLQEEFAAELATIRGQVDALEARTAELEANQFSTTTKLSGEVIFAIAGIQAGDTPAVADDNEEVIFADRVRLNFDTSFTGRDRLRTRLEALNITPFDASRTGTNMTRLGFDDNNGNDIELDELWYRFPIGNQLVVQIDATNGEWQDSPVYTFNPVFQSSGSGSISRFGRFNPIYRQPGGESAGITASYKFAEFNNKFTLDLGYFAANPADPANQAGLTDGTYAALAQLRFSPTPTFDIGATYVRAYYNKGGVDLTRSNGSALARRPFGNGVNMSANHFGGQVNWRVTPNINLGGWFGYTDAEVQGGTRDGQEAEVINWAAHLGLLNLLTEGDTLGFIFGMPPKLEDVDGGRPEDEDTSYHAEVLYKFPLSSNIQITPGLLVIFNPEHNDDNDTIFVGTIRTTFTF